MHYDLVKYIFDDLKKRDDELRNATKESIRLILTESKDKMFNFPDDPAYCYMEGCDGWFEECIYAVRLTDKNDIEVSTSLDHSRSGIPFDSEDYIFSEYNSRISINWLELLSSIKYSLYYAEHNTDTGTKNSNPD